MHERAFSKTGNVTETSEVLIWSLALYCGALACFCKYMLRVKCLALSFCVCGSPRVWETWQRGLFFEVWLYQCVFSVHSSHSFWKPSDQRELTSYISATMLRLKRSVGRRRVAKAPIVAFGVCVGKRLSLVAVVVVFVVTAKCRETSQTDPIREKYLGACIHPYL